jgi:hypothetical protein
VTVVSLRGHDVSAAQDVVDSFCGDMHDNHFAAARQLLTERAQAEITADHRGQLWNPYNDEVGCDTNEELGRLPAHVSGNTAVVEAGWVAFGPEGSRPDSLTVYLVREPVGWRIDRIDGVYFTFR